MIDYDKPDSDPIVAEVRQAREAIAAEHDYNLEKLFQAMKKQESTSGHNYSNRTPVKPLKLAAAREA